MSKTIKSIYINRFKVLEDKDDKQFTYVFPNPITHLEKHPLALMIEANKNITHMEAHPTSNIITFVKKFPCVTKYYEGKVRFIDNYYENSNNIARLIKDRKYTYYYDDILLDSELNRIKREIEEIKDRYNIIIRRFEIHIYKCIDEIEQNIQDCDSFCIMCIEQNCRHQSMIEYKEDEIDRLDNEIYEMIESINELKTKYKRELSKKYKKTMRDIYLLEKKCCNLEQYFKIWK